MQNVSAWPLRTVQVTVKQVLIKQGQVVVEDVPAPQVQPGTVLVRVRCSCLSIGTELSGIRESGEPLWRRALRYPDKVKKAVRMVAERGVSHTLNYARGKLAAGSPTGYSAAGVVLNAGSGVEDLRPGDRVACAGAQWAYHAEVICVPRNLVAPIPDNVGFPAASTTTLGAIALQGIRRAMPTLGETFVVIGLGILGQLTCQLLKANGCRVVGVDLLGERIALAISLGMNAGIVPEEGRSIEQVFRLTDGIGADGVIITAASPSDRIVSTGFQMCRKKGRVVLVGDVGLDLNRGDIYQKELDFLVSTSYGPGRYDRRYEDEGLDYPVAYVRWTENRNMGEYLRLLSEKKIKIAPLIGATYPLPEAPTAYAQAQTEHGRPLMVLLSYPESEEPRRAVVVTNPVRSKPKNGHIRVALVGAGEFGKAMLLPAIQTFPNLFSLCAIVGRDGANATATARACGARYATTDYQQVLKDPEIDAIVIATRHHLHGSMTAEGLEAGKHVFVEKPLALSRDELDAIRRFYERGSVHEPAPILMTGFNRRFSPHVRRVRELIDRRSSSMIVTYRMNAGHIPLTHWVHGPEGGGRNRGEACHIYDLFGYLTGSRVTSIRADAVRPSTGHYAATDNFVAIIRFEDGSLAALTYTALGSSEYPKEQMDLFVDGTVITMNDYRQVTVIGSADRGLQTASAEKGHKQEIEAFGIAVQQGGPWPIPLWQQLQATEISFEVEAALRSG